MVAWARGMFELLPSVTSRVRKGRASFGRSPYGKPRRGQGAAAELCLIDDDRGIGRGPVPEPDHIAIGHVHAAVRAVVLAGRVVVRKLSSGSIARPPVGVVDSGATVEPHHHPDLAIQGPVPTPSATGSAWSRGAPSKHP